MENLVFCLNATIPIFLTMLLGILFRHIGLFDEAFTAKLNRFVFLIALPALLFSDLSGVPFQQVWDGRFVFFCFSVTLLSILIACLLSLVCCERSCRSEFVQASYRSSAAILGIALIQNLYGNDGMAPLMIVSSVPLYNIMAVVVLTLLKPEPQPLTADTVRQTVLGILKNPILLGIAAGLLWSLFGIPQPHIMQLTVKNLAALATPLGLMVMGASFDIKKVGTKLCPVLLAGAVKLLLFCALFLPLAVHMGFHHDKLIAILVMLGSSTTVSCYIMARNMGHEGSLTSGAIMFTTFFSAFTLTGWLYLLRSFGLI